MQISDFLNRTNRLTIPILAGVVLGLVVGIVYYSYFSVGAETSQTVEELQTFTNSEKHALEKRINSRLPGVSVAISSDSTPCSKENAPSSACFYTGRNLIIINKDSLSAYKNVIRHELIHFLESNYCDFPNDIIEESFADYYAGIEHSDEYCDSYQENCYFDYKIKKSSRDRFIECIFNSCGDYELTKQEIAVCTESANFR